MGGTKGPLIFGTEDDPAGALGVNVEDEGVALGLATGLNFIGAGVVAFPIVAGLCTIRIDGQAPPPSGQVSATNIVSTASMVPVLLPAMNLVAVAAGTYLVNFSATMGTDTLNARTAVVIRAGGVFQLASERSAQGHRANSSGCLAIAGYRLTLAAPGDIEIYWGVSAGNVATDGPRSLSIVQVA